MKPSNILVLSTSLHSGSRSRLLAKFAYDELEKKKSSADEDLEVKFVDLKESPLPFCDGQGSYQDPNVLKLGQLIEWADGILISGPIYNYDFGAVAKNMIELVGKKMADKPIGLLCAAGGDGSFMAPMSFASSLMLDFRCLVLPRFVYATGSHFYGDQISDQEISGRITQLCESMLKWAAVSNS